VAAPLCDGDGRVIAAMNVTVHAAETPVEILTGTYLPWLLETAGAISADWAQCQSAPQLTVAQSAKPRTTVRPAGDNAGERMGSRT
jgi:IclR family pca regulon transcriptional regulator